MHRRRFASLWLCLPLALALQDPAPPKQEPAPAQPVVGKPAPEFRLNDHEGKGVAVGGASANWTVLAFYPKAATPG
jgi:peroxiredoxin Q/BCP